MQNGLCYLQHLIRRKSYSTDLPAVEARYHVKCYLYLCRGSVQPGIELNNTNQRNLNVEGRKCFHNVCHKIEKHSGLYSLEDFQNEMSLIIDKEYVYTTKQIIIICNILLHNLLQEKYGSEMFITYVSGRKNVICFHNVASKIINDQRYNEHWEKRSDKFFPLMTDLKSAPENLLNCISCKCKMVKKSPCSTKHCTCFKHGLPCINACKHCCGKVCDNSLNDGNTEVDIFTGELYEGLYEEIVETEETLF